MCGRFALTVPADVLARVLKLVKMATFQPRSNIAPTQQVPVIRWEENATPDGKAGRTLELLHWGLIPSWSKDKDIAAYTINARSEEVESKPSYRGAVKDGRRCLIPSSGFIEWERRNDGKQPHYYHAKPGDVLCFAGLWEHWVDKSTGEEIDSFTILTTNANGTVLRVHDRMPVVVEPKDYDRWLDPEVDFNDVKDVLRPAREDLLSEYTVSRRINGSKEDDPTLLNPMDIDEAACEAKAIASVKRLQAGGSGSEGRGKRGKSSDAGGAGSLFG